MQEAATALLLCNAHTSATKRLYTGDGTSELMAEDTTVTAVWSFALSTPAAGAAGAPSARSPNSVLHTADCTSPLCPTERGWQVNIQPELGDASSLLLELVGSGTSARHLRTTALSRYTSVRMCGSQAHSAGCGSEGQIATLALLPQHSSCVALIVDEVPQLLQDASLAAQRCPPRSLLAVNWPEALHDPVLLTTCVFPRTGLYPVSCADHLSASGQDKCCLTMSLNAFD